MPQSNNQNKFIEIKNFLIGSWSGAIVIIFSAITGIFAAGYWGGSYVTRTEYETKIMNMRIDQQAAISEVKEKAKEDAIKELKDQQLQVERLYEIMRGGKSK